MKVSELCQDNIEYKAQNKKLDEVDYLIADSGRIVIEKNRATIGLIQRTFRIGFNRVARIMDIFRGNGRCWEKNRNDTKKNISFKK